MSYMIRHNLTDSALEDLLELFSCVIPNFAMPSMYKFLKAFPLSKFNLHYFCPVCYCQVEFPNNSTSIDCNLCGEKLILSTLKRNGNYFIYISLKEQLQKLLSGSLYNKLQKNFATMDDSSDVKSGEYYKKLRRDGIIGENDICLQWNADGVQTFKSSKVSMCPIQTSILDLSYNVRKDNIILVGLWASTENPILDLHLKPFVDELQDLSHNGFQIMPPGFNEPIFIKVHTLVSPVDSVERCALQNVHQ